MSGYEFTADKTGSKAYFDKLNEYMEDNVLKADGEFICTHKEKCKQSCEDESRDISQGQLHHVGPLYDLKRNGKPFRIMVSGAEYSHVGSASLKTRTADISDLNPTNPHMNGTLCLLQLLFGCTPDNEELKIKIDGKQEKIFKSFSLANYLLCSGIKNGKRIAAYTNVMKDSCEDHFEKTLEILQPQIVVLQGMRAWNFFWNRYEMELNHKEADIKIITVCEKPILILPLYHPSYPKKAWGGAGHKAITNYVKPAVEKLLQEYASLVLNNEI